MKSHKLYMAGQSNRSKVYQKDRETAWKKIKMLKILFILDEKVAEGVSCIKVQVTDSRKSNIDFLLSFFE